MLGLRRVPCDRAWHGESAKHQEVSHDRALVFGSRVYTDEGHGLARPENRLHFFAKAEAFLAKYVGGRFEPLQEVKGHAGVMQ